ncbi:hypothetical protein BTJ40_14885 [Microbulbifer sp. A4B17]|uniref:antiviral reverse transcriptase Drt3a n=1 Tax=Microbulbifer sp. A4B17 TaxID=359370 RepID=UPI000D52D87A|nr:antiviral reverse transcriptase Drt3a [Microbulbifer sp. A4B17]AWF82009.1 hypothetical protein BTJ40_14885 [Microbulbifer sp. A4B17]
MFDQSFNRATIWNQLRYRDFVRHGDRLLGQSKIDIIDSAVDKARQGFSAPISLSSQFVGRQAVFTLSDLAEDLILRKVSQNLSKLTHAKQSDRNQIIATLKLVLEESVSYRVYKLDIKSFYESINVENLLERLRLNMAVSRPTYKVAKSFFDFLVAADVPGLPRGLALSATLSEIVMHDFDERVRSLPNVFFYNRYVDDIVLITDSLEDIGWFSSKISSLLPPDLVLNNSKTKLIDLPYVKPSSTQNLGGQSFDYLGYSFLIYGSQAKGEPRKVIVDIADKKVKKIKTRCSLAFLDYLRTRNFSLLECRIKFLASNYAIYDPDKKISRLAGIYYNYREVSPGYSKSIKALDSFLKAIVLANRTKISKSLSSVLTQKDKRSILKYSFKGGFNSKAIYSYSSSELEKIVRCWKHV